LFYLLNAPGFSAGMLTAGHEPYCRRTKIMTENYLDLMQFYSTLSPRETRKGEKRLGGTCPDD
jgi:hypothetical protein